MGRGLVLTAGLAAEVASQTRLSLTLVLEPNFATDTSKENSVTPLGETKCSESVAGLEAAAFRVSPCLHGCRRIPGLFAITSGAVEPAPIAHSCQHLFVYHKCSKQKKAPCVCFFDNSFKAPTSVFRLSSVQQQQYLLLCLSRRPAAAGC